MGEEELTADSSQLTTIGLGEKQIPRFARNGKLALNDRLFSFAGLDSERALGRMSKSAQAGVPVLLGAMNRAPTSFLGEVGLGTAAFSRVVDEVGGEVEDALEGVVWDVVVGLGLADFGS